MKEGDRIVMEGGREGRWGDKYDVLKTVYIKLMNVVSFIEILK